MGGVETLILLIFTIAYDTETDFVYFKIMGDVTLCVHSIHCNR